MHRRTKGSRIAHSNSHEEGGSAGPDYAAGAISRSLTHMSALGGRHLFAKLVRARLFVNRALFLKGMGSKIARNLAEQIRQMAKGHTGPMTNSRLRPSDAPGTAKLSP